MNVRDKNRAGKKLYINFKKDPWFQEILTYLYRKYDELAHRMSATFTYVTPDPIVNRSTHSSEFANIIREAGTIFDSTMSGLISKSGNSLNYDNNIHGFLKFLRDFDPYLEERPVLFNLRARKFIFPFERSQPEDPIPVWWKTYTDLKHNELVAFKKGNFENALTSVAAVAILSGYIQPRGGAVIFANTGIIDVNMEKLFV